MYPHVSILDSYLHVKSKRYQKDLVARIVFICFFTHAKSQPEKTYAMFTSIEIAMMKIDKKLS
jgi:hypothetical protein